MITRYGLVTAKLLACLAVVYAVLVGIGLLLTRVLDAGWLPTAEDNINTGLADHRTKPLNDLTYILSGLGNTAAIVAAMVVVAVGLRLALYRWRESVFLVVAVSGQALVFFCVQLTVTRQRPHVKRLDSSPPTSSFPSGHTGASTALYVASALLVEGGGVLHGSLFDAKLVDKVHAIIAPKIVGGSAYPAVAGAGVARMAEALTLRSVEVLRLGDDVAFVGYVPPAGE